MRRIHVYGGMVAALAAVFTVAVQSLVPTVETRVRVVVEEALDAKGVTWPSVEASGRSVVLAGSPSGEKERLEALMIARDVPLVFRASSELRIPDLTAATRVQDRPVGGDSLEVLPEEEDDVSDMTPPTRGEQVGEAGGETETGDDKAEESLTNAPDSRVATADPRDTPTVDAPPQDALLQDAPISDEPLLDAPAGQPRPAPTTDTPVRESCETRVTRIAHERVFFFASGASELQEEDRATVREIAQVLSGCREWTVTVVGYAGETEGEAAWSLSEKRARAVSDLLMRGGIDETRIAAVGGRHDQSSGLHERRVELYASGG